ncbi:hypothetical protein C8Q80DRAFT_1269961 [Daedaleopsis nitida]|nr:hypothetical protein C8Q80DRAFT_1269961 [Daedaleopsis nitida]
MSLSTGSYCNLAGPSGGEGMAPHATPYSVGSIYTANTRQDVLQGSATVKDAWASELDNRILSWSNDFESYLDTFVPSSDPNPTLPALNNPFSEYDPKPGQEVKSYTGLLSGLDELMLGFGDKKMTFVDASSTPLAFPFYAFADNHHKSKPDIAISGPGVALTRNEVTASKWEKILSILEAKSDEAQDPFLRPGQVHDSTIIQLARNARNLMLTHGLLAAFVIGVYGRVVRVARFDHTCAVVSQPFNIHTDYEKLRRFFWRFTHPAIGKVVVGCDPTVSRLDVHDKAWVKDQLRPLGENLAGFDKDIVHARRTYVYDDKTATMTPYIMYKAVDMNARLFSRATTVWRALEDTRSRSDGMASKPKVRILKDSWRQVVRQSEASFYHRLADRIPEEERCGLPKLECGGDLGQWEVRQWEQTSPNVSHMDGQREIRLSPGPYNSPTDSDDPSSPSSRAEDAEGSSIAPPDTFPIPFPLHQTFSWTLALGPEYTFRERSHMRFVVEQVGRPITAFKNTRELVGAFRDAIYGHMLAYQKAGVLHRDISVGNILIVDKPGDGSCRGFIHDFDYSSMVEEILEALDEAPVDISSYGDVDVVWETDEEDSPSPDQEDVHANLKERTGTYYFMAMDFLKARDRPAIHTPRHDLESFYWVLLWVVLRHTKHKLGKRYCEALFVYNNDRSARDAKSGWVYRTDEDAATLIFFKNLNLTILLRSYHRLIRENTEKKVAITHESVLAIFDQALATPEEEWPVSDWEKCVLLEQTKSRDSLMHHVLTPSPPSQPPPLPALINSLRGATADAGTGTVAHPPQGSVRSAPGMINSTTTNAVKKRRNEAEPEDDADQPIAGPSRITSRGSTASKRRRTVAKANNKSSSRSRRNGSPRL